LSPRSIKQLQRSSIVAIGRFTVDAIAAAADPHGTPTRGPSSARRLDAADCGMGRRA
jgi:hypothetical protein